MGLRRAWRRLVAVVPADVVVWEPDRKIHRPRAPEVAVRKLSQGAADVEAVMRVLPPDRATWVPSYFRRGDVGYVATVADRFAGWVWLARTTHRDPSTGLRVRLAPDEAYSYALYVDPDARRLGAGPAVVAAMLDDVKRDPTITRVYGWIDKGNRESQTLLRLLFGFRQVQSFKRVLVRHRFGRKVPFSDTPSFGPLSVRGRHRTGATIARGGAAYAAAPEGD